MCADRRFQLPDLAFAPLAKGSTNVQATRFDWIRFMTENLAPEHDYYDGSLYGLFQSSAFRHQNLDALDFMGRRTTYAALLEHVNALAAGFETLGIGKGDRVGIMLPNCPQAVMAVYATSKLGAIATMIHPLISVKELEHCLGLTGCSLLVTVDIFFDKATEAVKAVNEAGAATCSIVATRLVDELPWYAKAVFKFRAKKQDLPPRKVEDGDGVLTWDTLMEKGRLLQSVDEEETLPFAEGCLRDEPAAILFSGGTTGTPKGILLSNGNINSNMQQIAAATNFLPGERILTVLPLFHGFGLSVCLHSGLTHGLTCMLVPRLTIQEYSRIIVKSQCNYIVGVPTLLAKLIKLPSLNGVDLSFIKEVISGGDALPQDLRNKLNRFLAEHGSTTRVREGYGATELVSAACIEPAGLTESSTIGSPLKWNRIKIVDPSTLAEVPNGTDGELIISGPTVMMEYWKNPKETELNIFFDEEGSRWLHTGDMACIDESGFITYRGRIKRMIISNGYNIYPNQLEDVLNKSELVESSCVIGIPDKERIQRPKAFVVLNKHVKDKAAAEKQLSHLLSENVARYALPKKIEFIESMPLTKIGKIDYRSLEAKELEKAAQKNARAAKEIA